HGVRWLKAIPSFPLCPLLRASVTENKSLTLSPLQLHYTTHQNDSVTPHTNKHEHTHTHTHTHTQKSYTDSHVKATITNLSQLPNGGQHTDNHSRVGVCVLQLQDESLKDHQ